MIYILLSAVIFAVTPKGESLPLLNKSIVFIIAQNDFRDEEYLTPREIFDGLGANIVVASEDTTIARGMLGLTIKPDVRINDIRLKDFDITILVGGSGSVVFWGDERLQANLSEAADSGAVIGAICIAPGVLARAGLLKGKRATVFASPGAKKLFEEEGVIYTGKDVERDGRIITANGPASARQFAEEIVALITEINSETQKKQ